MSDKSEIATSKSDEITIVVVAEVKPGMAAEFENIFEENIQKSRLEAGILEFRLFKINNRPNYYALVERYVNQAALDHHMTLPQATDVFAVLDRVLTKPPIELVNFGSELFTDEI